MDWLKNHSIILMVLGAILGDMIWMNGQINELRKENAVIKTILMMKGITPSDFKNQEKK